MTRQFSMPFSGKVKKPPPKDEDNALAMSEIAPLACMTLSHSPVADMPCVASCLTCAAVTVSIRLTTVNSARSGTVVAWICLSSSHMWRCAVRMATMVAASCGGE